MQAATATRPATRAGALATSSLATTPPIEWATTVKRSQSAAAASAVSTWSARAAPGGAGGTTRLGRSSRCRTSSQIHAGRPAPEMHSTGSVMAAP